MKRENKVSGWWVLLVVPMVLIFWWLATSEPLWVSEPMPPEPTELDWEGYKLKKAAEEVGR